MISICFSWRTNADHQGYAGGTPGNSEIAAAANSTPSERIAAIASRMRTSLGPMPAPRATTPARETAKRAEEWWELHGGYASTTPGTQRAAAQTSYWTARTVLKSPQRRERTRPCRCPRWLVTRAP